MARTVVDSPIGPLGLVASDDGLRAVLFKSHGMRAEGRSAVLVEAVAQLSAYFSGDLVDIPALETELHDALLPVAQQLG